MGERPESQEVYHGAFINVRVETLPEPIGGTRRFEIVEHPDAVAIVALRPDPATADASLQVALVRQRRPAVGRDLWEIPAGIADRADGRRLEVTAARELREETGYDADVWQVLARELPSPGFSTEAITILLATGLRPASGAQTDRPADPTEIESVRWLPLAEALRLGRSGEIEDGKTLLGLTLAAARVDTSLGPAATGGSAMPRDAMNMPYKRPAVFRADESAPDAADAAAGALDGTLKLDNMLLEEFNYASVTAYQALEDRARMFNLYLLLIGVVASAVGAIYQLGKQNSSAGSFLQELVVLLLVVAAFLGLVFFLKVIYLRRAWLESARAMNAIKDFYIKQFSPLVPGVEGAFRWRRETIPHKRGAVTFLICYTMAFLGSICLAGAVFVAYEPWLKQLIGGQIPLSTDIQPWALAGIVGILFLLAHIAFWTRTQRSEERRTSLSKPGSKPAAVG